MPEVEYSYMYVNSVNYAYGQVVSFITVPIMPLEFTLENVPDEPNQLFASWMEPQPPNGVIMSYSLTCTLSSSQVCWMYNMYTYMYVFV